MEKAGFGGYVKETVEVVVFKRHKGNYLSYKFQKHEKYVSI